MAEHTSTTMDGLAKNTYGDDLENLVPEETSVSKDIKFQKKSQRPGNQFRQVVRLSRSHGWTIDTGGTAYALNAAEPCVTDEAQIQGVSFTVRESIATDMVASLLDQPSKEATERAFVHGTSYLMESMHEAGVFVREIALLHGSRDIGVIEAQTDNSGTSQTYSITAGTFIPALWSGMENGYIDVWDTAETTQRNSTGTIQVTSVDIDNLSLTLLGTETELDAFIAGDKIFLRGFVGIAMVGLMGIFSNTGTMWTIPGATYSLFTGNSHPAGSAQLIFATVQQALNRASNRGARGKFIAYCSNASWNDANNNLAALKRYGDKKGGSISQGADGIEYHTANGMVTLKEHMFMKPSETLIYPADKCKRIGPSDLTFKLPGMDGKEAFFAPLADNAGVQMRGYWNQAPFCPYPCHGVVITGLVNSPS